MFFINQMQRMVLNFTQSDLIRYIYKEVTINEKFLIEQAHKKDFSLYEMYAESKAAYDELPRVKFNPSTATLNAIMKYSSQTPVEA